MTSWRVAKSLETFIHQCNTTWPARNKASDGTIAGAAHHQQNPTSDHEPNSHGVVTAFDCTHDPAHGADMTKLAEALRTSHSARIKYVIWNHRMFSSYGNSSRQPWEWGPYNGVSAHTEHLHLSVSADPTLYDSPGHWTAFDILTGHTAQRVLFLTDPRMTGSDVGAVQKAVNAFLKKHHSSWKALSVDNEYGPTTASTVGHVQHMGHLHVDNKVGPDTRRLLGLS